MPAMSHAAPSSASPPPASSVSTDAPDLDDSDALDDSEDLDDSEVASAPAPQSAPRRAGKRQPPKLSTKQICAMRGEGHHLHPVVLIGKEGITDGLCAAVEAALDSHGLIKIRVSENAPSGRREAAAELCEKVAAALVQVLGRTALLYRKPPPKPAQAESSDAGKAGGRASTRSAGKPAAGRTSDRAPDRTSNRSGSPSGSGRDRAGSRPPRRGATSSR
jgi:RNA-binding protein